MDINDLDIVDVALLRILQKDATLTNKEIASKLKKSIATIHERTKRLNELGFIDRTVAILNRKKLNKSLLAFSHVLLNDHAYATLEAFEKEVTKFPEVMECFQMTGSFDFLLRVILPKKTILLSICEIDTYLSDESSLI